MKLYVSQARLFPVVRFPFFTCQPTGPSEVPNLILRVFLPEMYGLRNQNRQQKVNEVSVVMDELREWICLFTRACLLLLPGEQQQASESLEITQCWKVPILGSRACHSLPRDCDFQKSFQKYATVLTGGSLTSLFLLSPAFPALYFSSTQSSSGIVVIFP